MQDTNRFTPDEITCLLLQSTPGAHVAKRSISAYCTCYYEIGDSISQQLCSKVEMQGNENKSTTPRTVISFQRKEEEPPLVPFKQSRRALAKKAFSGFLEGMYICIYM